VKSCTTARFREMFSELPKPIQEQTRKEYRQFKEDPSYPSLRFKKVHPKLPIYSARINKQSCKINFLVETPRLRDSETPRQLLGIGFEFSVHCFLTPEV